MYLIHETYHDGKWTNKQHLCGGIKDKHDEYRAGAE